MFVNAVTLIDQTIENLQLLSELLRDDSDGLIHPHPQLTPETRTCEEAVATVDALVPQLKNAAEKLRAARIIQEGHGLPPQRVCANCDDF